MRTQFTAIEGNGMPEGINSGFIWFRAISMTSLGSSRLIVRPEILRRFHAQQTGTFKLSMADISRAMELGGIVALKFQAGVPPFIVILSDRFGLRFFPEWGTFCSHHS